MGATDTGNRMSRRSHGVWRTLVTVVLATGLAACSSSAASTSSTTGAGVSSAIPAFYTPPSPLPSAPPGTLIRAVTVSGVPGVPPGARVWRILYHSTTIYGADVAESGYVIAPPFAPPAGGYPVIAWAHGTTGFAAPCAPSLFTDPNGGFGPYLIPSLDRYLSAGYVVSAADYQGLGVSDGVHPYLLGSSEGRAVLDATRATRQLAGLRTADTVVIYGHSEGGHAALFAAEMAPTYAPDLHVVGVVAAAPATGLSTLISVMSTSVGSQFLPYSIPTAYAWSQIYTDLPESTLFTPAGEAFASSEVTRGCSNQVASAIADQHLSPTGVFATGAGSDPSVLAHARLNDPGNVRTTVPMLVVQGTADGTVPPPLTDAYVTTKACPIGDTVRYLHVKGATHGTVVLLAAATIVSWMNARLAGTPAPTTCGEPGDVAVLTP
jgi:alpha-beta hydrolase superfamily lysophospholipase